jgi:hypothetical protein|tara:strand:- start:686 stop:871 length:186 start_codon:yes stop_codon:yes gene_type:complete
MKHLGDLNNYACSLFVVKDPITKKSEIVIKFSFDSESEALEFAENFKLQSQIHESEKHTLH